MIIETKEVYKCEHCRKLYQIKKFAIIHEQVCKKNPENYRACFGCKFLIKKEATIFEDHPMMGESQYDANILFCSSKNIFVYPPIVEHKGNSFELGDELNEPMPIECELYKDQYED